MGWHMSMPASSAIDAWYRAVRGEGDAPKDTTQTQVRGDILYSYGPHFELARPLRDKSGLIRGYLLNGDTYSNITSQHQAHVRHVLSSQKTVIIPHEALNSAGIDLDSVQIVDVTADTWTTTHRYTTERPPRSKWVDHPIYADRRLTDEEVAAQLDKRHAEALKDYNQYARWHQEALDRGQERSMWERYLKDGPPKRPDKLPESAMTVRYVASYDRKLHRNGREWGDEIDVQTSLPDGTTEYRWEERRHWLGESLVRARVTWRTFEEDGVHRHHRWAYYLSGFDHEEARPLYFFAELPRGSKPTTVAEAYECLKPDPVKLAEQMGRPIFRQGDIFGIPTRLDRKALKAQGARVVRRNMNIDSPPERPIELPYVLGTNHTATEVAYLPNGVTLARGTMYHDPSGRRPDHARRRIGDGKSWHVVIKNTVPTVRR